MQLRIALKTKIFALKDIMRRFYILEDYVDTCKNCYIVAYT